MSARMAGRYWLSSRCSYWTYCRATGSCLVDDTAMVPFRCLLGLRFKEAKPGTRGTETILVRTNARSLRYYLSDYLTVAIASPLTSFISSSFFVSRPTPPEGSDSTVGQ